MKKENPIGKNIDLIPFLQKIVRQNTKGYQSDLRYDVQRLKDAVTAPSLEDRVFYWMSRPHGTWCVRERDAFLQGTDGHTIWSHYADTPEGIAAYRMTVTGLGAKGPVGEAVKLDYPAQVKRVEQNALPLSHVELTFHSGDQMTMPMEQYLEQREYLFQEYGMIVHLRYCPWDETELARVIEEEHRQQAREAARLEKAPRQKPRSRQR